MVQFACETKNLGYANQPTFSFASLELGSNFRVYYSHNLLRLELIYVQYGVDFLKKCSAQYQRIFLKFYCNNYLSHRSVKSESVFCEYKYHKYNKYIFTTFSLY